MCVQCGRTDVKKDDHTASAVNRGEGTAELLLSGSRKSLNFGLCWFPPGSNKVSPNPPESCWRKVDRGGGQGSRLWGIPSGKGVPSRGAYEPLPP